MDPERRHPGFDLDGREVWRDDIEGKVLQFSGTPLGGVAASITSNATQSGTLRIYGADGSRTEVPGVYRFAISEKGPLWAVDGEGYLVGHNIGLGGGTRIQLPRGTVQKCAGGCEEPRFFGAGTPTIFPDDSVVVPVATGLKRWTNQHDSWDATITVVRLKPDQTVETYVVDCGPVGSIFPFKAVPNGLGGMVVGYDRWNFWGPDWQRALGFLLDANGQKVGFTFALYGVMWKDLILEENGWLTAISATAWEAGVPGSNRGIQRIAATGGLGNLTILDEGVGVTSIQAAPGGGATISYTDGTVTSPVPQFFEMGMAHARALTTDVFVYYERGARIAVVRTDIIREPNSVWPTGLGGRGSANAAGSPGRGIFVKGHTVQPAPMFKHTSIRLAPRNQYKWKVEELDWFMHFTNVDTFGNYFATLGAAATLPECLGYLRSDINRHADVHMPYDDLEPLVYLPIFEDKIIRQLFEADNRFPDETLEYMCVSGFPNQYNSNGYIHGLLKALELPVPLFPQTKRRWWGNLTYLHFDKPVPASYFLP